MRISQKTSVCRHCGTRMGSLVAIEKPGWRILHLTLLNLHNWFNMIIDFIIKIIISANQEILDTWCRAIESRKESAFLWLTSHTFQFFSLCSGWIWFVISATCALLLFVIFSTARCSSSRNSLRGIHSITHHPVHILVAVLPPALMVFLRNIWTAPKSIFLAKQSTIGCHTFLERLCISGQFRIYLETFLVPPKDRKIAKGGHQDSWFRKHRNNKLYG